MATERDLNRGKQIRSQLDAANSYFESWENKFQCKTLERYYEGFQWEGTSEDLNKYTLNMVFSTFQIKRPTLLFKKPIYYCEPKPQNADYSPESAFVAAQLAADTLNTFATSSKFGLGREAELAVLDAGSHFGMLEVGFEADWIVNPNAGKPVLLSDEEPVGDRQDEVITEPEEIPEEERIYVKRIPAHRFRTGSPEVYDLSQANWYGYYEFVRKAELTKGYKNLDEVTGSSHFDYKEEFLTESGSDLYSDYVKIWKLWTPKLKQFEIFSESGDVVVYESEFKRTRLFPLIFHRRRRSFYPIPYFFNWKSPQDEINECRTTMRDLRRRAKRAWLSRKNAIDETEREKLITGPTDQIIEVDGNPADIQPLASPAIDASIQFAFPQSKDDFNVISGTSSETRGQADRTTATQANITNQRASIREADEKEVVALWLCEIGKEILAQIIDNMTLPFWVKLQSDIAAWGTDAKPVQDSWRLITSSELGNLDYTVNVTVESLSPVANDQEKKKFMEFLAIVSQYPMVALNPDLIRECAYRVDYRNEKVIMAMQQAAMLQMMGQMAQGGGPQNGQSGPNPNMDQKTVEQMQPPDQAELENQMAAYGNPPEGY